MSLSFLCASSFSLTHFLSALPEITCSVYSEVGFSVSSFLYLSTLSLVAISGGYVFAL